MIVDILSLIFYYGIVLLCLAPFIFIVCFPLICLFEYIADSDIWVRKEDRDQ